MAKDRCEAFWFRLYRSGAQRSADLDPKDLTNASLSISMAHSRNRSNHPLYIGAQWHCQKVTPLSILTRIVLGFNVSLRRLRSSIGYKTCLQGMFDPFMEDLVITCIRTEDKQIRKDKPSRDKVNWGYNRRGLAYRRNYFQKSRSEFFLSDRRTGSRWNITMSQLTEAAKLDRLWLLP